MQQRSPGRNLLRASLISIALIISLGGIYLGVIGVLSWLLIDVVRLDDILDVNTARQLSAGLATILVVVLFNPARQRVERLTDRFVLRGRMDRRQALLAFTRQLHLIQTLDPLLGAMVELIDSAIAPRFCAILLSPRSGDPMVTVRQAGVVPVDLGMVSSTDPLLMRALDIGEAFSMDSPVDGSAAWQSWRQKDVAFVVPLVVSEGLVGLLVLGSKQPRGVIRLGSSRRAGGYSLEDLWMLNALAAQSTAVMETARLHDQFFRRTYEDTALFEVGTAISSSLEEAEVLDATSSQLIRLLQVDGCVISDWDEVKDCTVVLISEFVKGEVTPFEPGTVLSLSDHPARQVLQTKLTRAVSAVESPDEARRISLIADGQMYVVLMLPLVARDDVIGLVELYTSAPRRTFTQREIKMGQILVNQAAVTIANARLYEQTRRRATELSALVETGAVVSTILGVQGALQRISQELVRLLRAAGCRVSSWDRERDLIISWLDFHVPDAVWVPGPLGTAYSLESRPDFAQVLSERSIVAVAIPLPGQTSDVPLRPDTTQTVLVLPLVARGEVIGVIEVGATHVGRVFTEWEIGLAQTMVSLAATAIENARTYEDQRIAARNLERKVEARTAELNEALHSLRVESSKREAILEGVADGVLFADEEGEITLFNVAAERLLGFPRRIALGNSVEGFVSRLSLPGEAWEEIPSRWAELHDHPEAAPFVEQQYQVDDRTFNVRFTPVVHEGQFLGTVAVWRDVTKDVELNRAKSAFVSSVAHELRIPMTSIKGYTDLLLTGAVGALNEKQAEFLRTVQGNAERLTTLVTDLLDISRVETGRMRLKLAKVDLNRVAGDVVASLRPRADEKDQRLTNEVPVNLPPVRADIDRVAQILINLIGNAIAYTPEKGSIRVLGRLLDGHVQVDIVDTGIGIAGEEQARIWERFYRSEDPAVSGQVGTGLGLSIVRTLVELHGGRVWVESESGAGSTFSFMLPVASEVLE